MVRTLLIALTIIGTLALPQGAEAAAPFKKVMIVIFENMKYSTVMKEPFFSGFAKGGANLVKFYAETHPSQANYIALTAGSLHGVPGDGNIDLDVRHIGDLLEEKGLSWKAYIESWPGKCYRGARSGTYARKHNPFISFVNVQKNPDRCDRIVNSSELPGDIAMGTLPDYSIYVPDMKNDGHDTDAAYADRWFGRAFGPLLRDPKFTQDMLVIATFDEDDYSGLQHIYTAVWGEMVRPGTVSQQKYNHYSILRTIEDAFGLGTLGLEDAKATPITDIWR